MKHLKKIMAVLVTMVMVLGMMSMAAVADEPDTINRKIAVTGLEKDDTVNFYKVLGWAGDKTNEEQADLGAVSGWYPLAPFDTVLDEDTLKAAIDKDNKLMLTDELAGKLARALNGESVDPVNGDEAIKESSGTAEYVFKNQAAGSTAADGLYMAIVTPKDQNTVYNPIFVHLDSSTNEDSYAPYSSAQYYNQGSAKKSTVTLEKEAHNEADYTTPADDGDTTKPGDVLTFTVKSTIPGYGKMFEAPFFIIKDQMKDLKLLNDATNKIVVKVDGAEVTANETDTYKLTWDENGYTIEFATKYLKSHVVASPVEITYKAEVKSGANTNVIKEKNTVTVEFSHDPTTETEGHPGGDKQYKKDITNHYTFSIDANNLVGPYGERIGESGSEIIKIGVDKDGNPIKSETKTYSNVTTTEYQAGPLDGAEFELLDKNHASFNPRKLATSDASGRLNFTGLDAGVYYLKETKAPAGYVKNTDEIKITINATLRERTITEYYDQAGNWYTEEGTGRTKFEYKTDELVSYSVTYGEGENAIASSYTFNHAHESSDEIKWSIATSSEAPQSIANVKGVELPSTGGIGTTIFYIVGAILVVGAGVLLVTRRRMAED